VFTASRTDEKFLRKGRSTYPINGPNPSHQQPENWWVSVDLGGSPGLSDAIPFNGVSEDEQCALGPAEDFTAKIIDGIPCLEFARIVANRRRDYSN
jgi:hypothetical protein